LQILGVKRELNLLNKIRPDLQIDEEDMEEGDNKQYLTELLVKLWKEVNEDGVLLVSLTSIDRDAARYRISQEQMNAVSSS
jgi:hypothetical protein